MKKAEQLFVALDADGDGSLTQVGKENHYKDEMRVFGSCFKFVIFCFNCTAVCLPG